MWLVSDGNVDFVGRRSARDKAVSPRLRRRQLTIRGGRRKVAKNRTAPAGNRDDTPRHVRRESRVVERGRKRRKRRRRRKTGKRRRRRRRISAKRRDRENSGERSRDEVNRSLGGTERERRAWALITPLNPSRASGSVTHRDAGMKRRQIRSVACPRAREYITSLSTPNDRYI